MSYGKEEMSDIMNCPGEEYHWISICSRHPETDYECELCVRGAWVVVPYLTNAKLNDENKGQS
jgi:hypothetical protein